MAPVRCGVGEKTEALKPESYLSLSLEPDLAATYKKTQEFTAIHAFLLGLRTGEGLALSRP